MKKDRAGKTMDESRQETDTLSEGASELLDAWLQSQEYAAEPDAPEVAALVAYLSGALSTDARRVVERGLVLHPSTRSLLRSTRESLRMLRMLPWSEVAQRRQVEGLAGQIAQAWLTLTVGAVAAAPSAQERWKTQGWPAIRGQMAAGAIEAKAAWTNFLSFGDQLRAAFQMVAPAVARSGSETPALLRGVLPPDIELAIHAEVDAEGTLQATLFVRDLEGSPSLLLNGTQMQLLLFANGQTWPLAHAMVEDNKVIWTLPELGTALGLAVGTLPTAYLCIALSDAPALPTESAMYLLAEVLDSVGEPTGHPPVSLELRSEPRWVEGQFHLTIALSEPVRIAYAAYQLRLDVVVSKTFRQCLGYWPIGDWLDSPCVLTADCPNSRDAAIPYASVLHAALQPLPVS